MAANAESDAPKELGWPWVVGFVASATLEVSCAMREVRMLPVVSVDKNGAIADHTALELED